MKNFRKVLSKTLGKFCKTTGMSADIPEHRIKRGVAL